jgi:hypothetical protein
MFVTLNVFKRNGGGVTKRWRWCSKVMLVAVEEKHKSQYRRSRFLRRCRRIEALHARLPYLENGATDGTELQVARGTVGTVGGLNERGGLEGGGAPGPKKGTVFMFEKCYEVIRILESKVIKSIRVV